MKKPLLLAAFICGTVFSAFAQQTSFESSSGFTLGPLDGQQGWTILDPDDTTTKISNEKASQGTYSLKIKGDNTGDHAITRGARSPEYAPIAGNITQVTMDIYITTEANTSDINVVLENMPSQTSWVIFGYDYIFYVYGFEGYINTGATFSPGVWYALKIVHDFGNNTIKYYLNNTLVYTGPTLSGTTVQNISFNHQNYSNGAYIDNLKVNNGTLGNADFTADSFMVYPNPATDAVMIRNSSESTINAVSISDTNGRIVETISHSITATDKIPVDKLAPGVYLLTISSDNGTFTKKIIKN